MMLSLKMVVEQLENGDKTPITGVRKSLQITSIRGESPRLVALCGVMRDAGKVIAFGWWEW